ncbi:MAG: hypothetical protein K0Q49_1627 [Haloplasmataceae bacterium]|jgi:NAD(P) transhydrogenase subunit alpha|nr:hypothetical protein [Haloplasmataceae bacterium]
MSALVIILIFVVSTIVGYLIIKNVPSLLHTPLMSGMNALSGITILGALTTVSIMTKEFNAVISGIVGGLAVILAMINVVGGFGVTHRMLKMFNKKGSK